MINEITVSSIDDAAEILKQQTYSEKSGSYRSRWLYRGMPDAAFTLETTLERACRDKAYELEEAILRSFSKYAPNEVTGSNVWERMVIGQNYGLPTRLMDWSHSPLIALHFSTSGEDLSNMDKHDSVIWRIDIDEINSLLPAKYKEILSENKTKMYTAEMLEKSGIGLHEYDKDMDGKAAVILEPDSLDERIVRHYGNFLIVPKKMDVEQYLKSFTEKTEKYIIKASARWRIRDMLDELNVNERLLWPGTDGVCKTIYRHYYVRQ